MSKYRPEDTLLNKVVSYKIASIWTNGWFEGIECISCRVQVTEVGNHMIVAITLIPTI